MPYEALDAGRWAARPDLPQPDRASLVVTGEQVSIRTPGQRGDRAGMRHLLDGGAQLRIPELDGRLMPPSGKQAAIGGKSQAGDPLRLPARPARCAALDIPELDAAIQAPTGERAFVRAEGESPDPVRVGSPDPVQELPFLAPQPHFPPSPAVGPVLPVLADSHGGDGIEALGPDALLELRPSQIGVLQLGALQVGAANGEPRQVQAAQVP